MTRPIQLPDDRKLYEVCEATWPPATATRHGAWTIREGGGGGKRVSSATETWPTTEADLATAEKAMRALGQVPIFQIRRGEEALDEILDHHGYDIVDPVNLYAIPVRELTGEKLPSGTVFTIWPPLQLMLETWAEGGIGPGRLAVMERACEPKTGLFVRVGQDPAGVGFAAIHDGIAMVHALHVPPEQRRRGAATLMLRGAAHWAASHGCDVLTLIVTQGNHAANPLYASLGMRLVGHYHYRWKPEAKD